MRSYWIKLMVGPIVAEILAILILVVLVAFFGPQDAEGAQIYADKLGCVVGPVAGILLSFLGAFWIARPLAAGNVFHGALFGVVMALIDMALLIAMKASFEWILVASNAGKMAAAVAGGFCATRHRASTNVG